MLSVTFETDDELFALVGPSGGGKSAVLRAIAGVFVPDSGSISVGERTLFSSGLGINLPPSERHVGYVPQVNALFPHLTVGENVQFPLTRRQGHLRGADRRVRRASEARVEELLSLLDLDTRADMYPDDLHPLDYWRAATARALIADPVVLLLDDPFATFDSATRRQARTALRDLAGIIRIPIVIATVELEEAYEVAARMALLDHGRILQTGTPRSLLMRPANRRVAELVRAINVLPGEVVGVVEEFVDVQTPLGILRAVDIAGLDGAVDVVVRPEHVRVLPPSQGTDVEAANVVVGQIVGDERHGSVHALLFSPEHAPDDPPLQILLTDLSYDQLALGLEQRRAVVVPPQAVHLMPRESDESGART
jgi:ABC-type Fe3+/spermidine/putrescine transport system ATPase subunit